MSQTRKPFKELSLIDDFLSTAIAANEKLNKPCYRRILSVLLEKEIGEIQIRTQSVIPATILGMRGIRLDVEVRETSDGEVTNVYDLEPHTQKDLNFPKHNRFYAAKIDSRHVRSGLKDFSAIPNLYILTITNFDIFGEDQMVYTIKHHCVECPEMEYEDGMQIIYFNTAGKTGGSQAIRNMLRYIEESTASNAVDEATREIHSYVEAAKQDPEMEDEYMTVGDLMDMKAATVKREADLAAINNIISLLREYNLSFEEIVDKLHEKYPAYSELIPDIVKKSWEQN